MKTLLIILFDIAVFEIIVVNTVLWIKSERIIKKYFHHREPFERAGIFRTPLICENSRLPKQFLDEWFAVIKQKNNLGVASIVTLIVTGFIYSNF